MSNQGFHIVTMNDRVSKLLAYNPTLDLHGFWHEGRKEMGEEAEMSERRHQLLRQALLTPDSLRTIHH